MLNAISVQFEQCDKVLASKLDERMAKAETHMRQKCQ
jgi:hypothetical protein